jgi:hypothetical protein
MEVQVITIADKQFLAKILYTREHLDGKVVAKKVGVSEKTISKWVTEFNWKALRRRLLLSKEEQLNSMYEQLECLNKAIKKNDTKHADTKQADILIKYSAAIRNLETDLNIADLVESGIRFIKHLQKTGTVEQVMDVTDMWYSFIQFNCKK